MITRHHIHSTRRQYDGALRQVQEDKGGTFSRRGGFLVSVLHRLLGDASALKCADIPLELDHGLSGTCDWPYMHSWSIYNG